MIEVTSKNLILYLLGIGFSPIEVMKSDRNYLSFRFEKEVEDSIAEFKIGNTLKLGIHDIRRAYEVWKANLYFREPMDGRWATREQQLILVLVASGISPKQTYKRGNIMYFEFEWAVAEELVEQYLKNVDIAVRPEAHRSALQMWRINMGN